MATVTAYDQALAHLRQRATGPDPVRDVQFAHAALVGFAREFSDPARLDATIADLGRAYRAVLAEAAVPRPRVDE